MHAVAEGQLHHRSGVLPQRVVQPVEDRETQAAVGRLPGEDGRGELIWIAD